MPSLQKGIKRQEQRHLGAEAKERTYEAKRDFQQTKISGKRIKNESTGLIKRGKKELRGRKGDLSTRTRR